MNPGWVGGRGRSIYNFRLPPKASDKDTGCLAGARICKPDSRAPAKQSWHHGGPMLAYVGPMFILGALLGPCLGQLCWNDLKMPIFPPRAPAWSPKPRKTEVFEHRQDEIPCCGRARNTVKKTMFFNTANKSTANYIGFNRPRVDRQQGAQRL